MNPLTGLQARIKQIRRMAILVLIAAKLWGQGSPSPAPLPTHVLYEQFFRYQRHLDHAAAAVEKQGKTGAEFRNHFQQKLRFTDKQFVLVLNEGMRLQTDLGKQDAKGRGLGQYQSSIPVSFQQPG